MIEVIIIAAIVLVAAAGCYWLYRWSRAAASAELLDPAARRAVKDAQAAHEQHNQYGEYPGGGFI